MAKIETVKTLVKIEIEKEREACAKLCDAEHDHLEAIAKDSKLINEKMIFEERALVAAQLADKIRWRK